MDATPLQILGTICATGWFACMLTAGVALWMRQGHPQGSRLATGWLDVEQGSLFCAIVCAAGFAVAGIGLL